MADIYGFEEEKNEPDMVYDEPVEENLIKETASEKKPTTENVYPKLSSEEIEKKADDKIIDALKKVRDPEIDMDIWNLGLIYNLEVRDKKIDIVMTFTSPMCPFGPQIVDNVKKEIKEAGYDEPEVELVFNPLWEPSAEVKEMLGV